MKRFRAFIGFAALALVLASIAAPAHGQSNAKSAFPAKGASSKPVWLKGEVVRADGQSVTVRERDNPLALHTFSYGPNIQEKMWKLLEHGGYQYGDKVSILYQPGQTVALKIHGKPSKPI